MKGQNYPTEVLGILKISVIHKIFSHILVTQFEMGIGARSIVPCWDEPDFKSKWRVTLEHPAEFRALGNMIEKYVEALPNSNIFYLKKYCYRHYENNFL